MADKIQKDDGKDAESGKPVQLDKDQDKQPGHQQPGHQQPGQPGREHEDRPGQQQPGQKPAGEPARQAR